MYSASDLRKGLRVEIDGVPYIITDFTFVKPGKGASIYNCKMKNLVTSATLNRSYRSNDKLDEPKLEERTMRYSYLDGDNYVFIDKNTLTSPRVVFKIPAAIPLRKNELQGVVGLVDILKVLNGTGVLDNMADDAEEDAVQQLQKAVGA